MGFVKTFEEIMARSGQTADFYDAEMLVVFWETRSVVRSGDCQGPGRRPYGGRQLHEERRGRVRSGPDTIRTLRLPEVGHEVRLSPIPKWSKP